MKYVYILESLNGEHFYIGITDDVPARLSKHNAGEVPHTSKYRPWRVRTYIAFCGREACRGIREVLEVRVWSGLRQETSVTPPHRPVNRGARFSTKLATPSLKSAPRSEISISRLASMVASLSVWKGTS